MKICNFHGCILYLLIIVIIVMWLSDVKLISDFLKCSLKNFIESWRIDIFFSYSMFQLYTTRGVFVFFLHIITKQVEIFLSGPLLLGGPKKIFRRNPNPTFGSSNHTCIQCLSNKGITSIKSLSFFNRNFSASLTSCSHNYKLHITSAKARCPDASNFEKIVVY